MCGDGPDLFVCDRCLRVVCGGTIDPDICSNCGGQYYYWKTDKGRELYHSYLERKELQSIQTAHQKYWNLDIS
jgi:hypothetical protein